MKPQHRHAARAVAVLASAALAASSAVVLAPSANAYWGAEANVAKALLPTSVMLKTGGWTGAPLAASVQRLDPYSFARAVPPTPALTATTIVPEFTQLVVLDDTADRNAAMNAYIDAYGSTGTSISRADGAFTYNKMWADNGDGTAILESYSVRPAGSDGYVVAGCLSSTTTTRTAWERGQCSRAVSKAQAAKWQAVSPSFTRKPASKIRARLLTGKQARVAVKVPKGLTVKAGPMQRQSNQLTGIEYWRSFTTNGSKSALKKKMSLPAIASIIEFGNRTNANVAFASWKASDRKAGKLYNPTSTRYTVSFTTKSGGKKVKMAVTVSKYSDVIVTGACVANARNQSSAASVRTCSKRLAAAQVTKAKPLFKNVR